MTRTFISLLSACAYFFRTRGEIPHLLTDVTRLWIWFIPADLDYPKSEYSMYKRTYEYPAADMT